MLKAQEVGANGIILTRVDGQQLIYTRPELNSLVRAKGIPGAIAQIKGDVAAFLGRDPSQITISPEPPYMMEIDWR